MNHIIRLLMLLAASLLCTTLSAQNTLRPRPLNEQFDATHVTPPLVQYLGDTSVFQHKKNGFIIGGQWGNGEFRKVNQALSNNFENGGGWTFFRMNATPADTAYYASKLGLRDLDTNVVNYLGWQMSWGYYHDTAVQKQWFRSWIGMRWEPAEDWHTGDSWTPRDSASWPYAFQYSHPQGIVSSDTTNTNYRRFMLDTSQFSSGVPIRVLDSCNPRVNLYRGATRGGESNTDSTDGLRMYLVINLRRLSSTDTDVDDTTVLRLQVRGNRFEPDITSDNPDEYLPAHFNFNRIPDGTGSLYNLREGRGKVLRMVNAGLDTTNEMHITRRMLPTGSNRDITITAEFMTDTVYGQNAFGWWRDLHAHLKTEEILNHGTVGTQFTKIDTMTPIVWFYDSTSVAIQSISIVTPYTFHALCGAYDSAYAVALNADFRTIDSVRKFYRDSVGCQKPLYIEHLYGVDEIGTRDDLGMYYRSHLLNGFCNTETGYEGPHWRSNYRVSDARKRMHIMPFAFFWTSGLGFTGTFTPSPMFPYSDPDLVKSPYLTLNLRQGYDHGLQAISLRRPYAAAYETLGSTNYFISNYEPFGSPLAAKFAPDSVYERIMTPDGLVGAMGTWEKSLYIHFYKNNWFFTKPKTPWITHAFYHYRMNLGWKSDSSDTFVQLVNWRPQSGEEVRLELSTALAFGSKGFAYDKMKDVSAVSHKSPAQVVSQFGRHDTINHVEPGMIMNKYTKNWDTDTNSKPSNILQKDSLGGDYFPADDPWHMDEFRSRASVASAMQLHRCFGNDSTDRIYLGQKSMRCEVKKWHDLVTHADFKDVLYRMQPVSWYGQGYRKLIKGNMSDLNYWIDTTKANLKMYLWTKDSVSDYEYALRPESIPERFYDYVLLDIAPGTAAVHDSCVLAVINRRTAPGIIDFTRTDSIEVLSTYDFDQRVLSQPEYRYRQLGARRIVIPFKYDQAATTPSLLHVKEISLDSVVRIDTIISDRSQLVVDFKPGQTRFFQIKRMQATDTVNTGFLAYSTQNKLVSYPVVNATNAAYTDSIRYHLAYHRKDDSTDYGGVWAVYYQRSIPYHRDSLPLVAGLKWETPIRLTGMTRSSVTKTDALNRTMYFDIDSTTYLSHVPLYTESMKNCCCGFPSIVVREVTAFHPKIFVVYSCEDEWATNEYKDSYFHIVENAFNDDATLNPATLDGNGKSLIICGKGGTHDRGVDTLKSLARWGTPVINAASAHNMYYAWSADGGIGAATKADTVDWFPAYDAWTAIPIVNISQGDLTMDGGSPQLPSLNVYSNLSQNRTDATLVWREGTTNPHIRYTRLIQGLTATAIDRMLPAFIGMTYVPAALPAIPINALNRIAVVGGAAVDDDADLPVVVRSIQQDTMKLFERDTNGFGSLYKYNLETVAWEEYVRSTTRNRVRYNHFIDRWGYFSTQVKFWYANTTYGDFSSLFHPVLTNAHVWMDSLHWEGWVDDSTFVTYGDSLFFKWGNNTDSALIVNYNVLPQGSYLDLNVAKTAAHATYWTGLRQFSNLVSQQIMIRRLVGVPQPPGITVHPLYLRAGGAWPHVAMRQRENWPNGVSAVRRVLQYTSGIDPAPSLVASAEQFYKLSDDVKTPEPVTSGGVEVGMQRITARAVLSDGRSVSFRAVYDNIMPEGYHGSAAFAWQTASMTTPVRELVTETFSIGDVDAMKLVSTGLLRENIAVTIEEVDPASTSIAEDGTPTTNNFNEPDESAQVTLAQGDEEAPDNAAKALYYLTSGDDKLYRLRMKYTGTDAVVYHEDLNIDPEEESFEKAGSEPVRIVNLRTMKGERIGGSSNLRIYPNPSSDRVTIIIDGSELIPGSADGQSLVLDVVDGLGRMILTSPVMLGEAVDVSGLPDGVYVARVRVEGVAGSAKASGTFTILK